MKKFLAIIFSILIFFQNPVLASSLYLIQNPSKSVVKNVVENAYISKSFIIYKFDPYYGVSKKNSTKIATVILQEDVKGLYYYFDGDSAVNTKILKDFNKKNLVYSEVNTRLKDSFDNMAKEKIFGQKIDYYFDEQPQTPVVIESNRANYNAQQSGQPSAFTPDSQPIPTKTTSDYSQQNIIYGYIGKLAAGTEIYAYLQNPLNTESAQKGDTVTLVVSRDLLYNGSVVAPQGSIVTGRIINAKSAGYMQKNGKIEINFDTLTLPSGKVYKIATEKIDFKVESDEKKSGSIASKVVVGAATSALVGLLFGAMSSSPHLGPAAAIGAGVGAVGVGISEASKKGVDAEIPAYTEINLVLTEPLNVTKN